MVSHTQSRAGASAASSVGASAAPEPSASELVITRVKNAETKLATVIAKQPSQEEKSAAALRLVNMMQSNELRSKLDLVTREIESLSHVQKLSPPAALHILETASDLGPDIPDWLKDRIEGAQDILVKRALIPEVTLSEAEYLGSPLDKSVRQLNLMLETSWGEMNARDAKAFYSFLKDNPELIKSCDERSQIIILDRQNKIEGKFLTKKSDQTLAYCSAEFNAYAAAPNLIQNSKLAKIPTRLNGEELCSLAYTLVAAKQLGHINQTSFDTKWEPIKAALDEKALTKEFRYMLALNFELMNICSDGYEASLSKDTKTTLLKVLEYVAKNASSTTEIDDVGT